MSDLARPNATPPIQRLLGCLAGQFVFAAGLALLLHAKLGTTPWGVLSDAVSQHTPLTYGGANAMIGALALACSVLFRQQLGVGSLLHAVLVSFFADVVLAWLPRAHVALWPEMLLGIVLTTAGTGAYIAQRMGPGPRDAMLLGLSRRANIPIWAARALIEVPILVVGVLLGGKAGLGTLAFVVLGPPLTHYFIGRFSGTLPPGHWRGAALLRRLGRKAAL